MGNSKTNLRSIAVTFLIAASAVIVFNPLGAPGSGVAMAQGKAQARQSLTGAITSLRALDTAYASGNSAEAQSRYDNARENWNKVSPRISAREAREAQLLFDHLGGQLKASAPPAQVRRTVSGLVGELREDIEREIR